MAEYKLSYTASEIDEKLGQIDDLSTNKLDASALDSAIDAALAEAKANGEFDGKDGISIINAEINDNGELIITYSNNTTSNLGIVVGENGEPYELTDEDKAQIAQEVSNMITVPTKTSELTNDSDFVTSSHNHDDAYDAKGSAESALTSANEYTDEYMAGVEEVLTQTMMILYGEENWEKFLEGEMLSVPEMTIPVITEAFTYHNNDGSVHSDIRELIEGLTTSKVSVSDIINSLTSDATNKPLSAAQGKALKALIDAIKVPTKLSELSGDAFNRTVTDTEKSTWNDKSNFSGKYGDLTNRPFIPTHLSDLSEDTSHRTVTDAEKAAWDAKSNFSGSYNDLTNKPTIPTKTSELTNDSGFLTQHQDISGKADKSQGIFYIEGDSSSTTDTTNKVATWIGSHDEITEYFNGLTILYKVVTAGSTTTTLNINSLGAATVVRNATTGISTACPVDGILLLTYTVDSNGTSYWKTADYDTNTKNTAGTSNKTGTKLYLVGGGSQSSSGVTTYTNSNIYIDTSNVLNSGKGFKGALVGNADTATKATQDASGNVITSTYETKADAAAMYEQLSAEIDAKLGVIENGSY